MHALDLILLFHRLPAPSFSSEVWQLRAVAGAMSLIAELEAYRGGKRINPQIPPVPSLRIQSTPFLNSRVRQGDRIEH